MSGLNDCIYIFKAVPDSSPSNNDPYSKELERRGFTSKVISVLDFKYKNTDVLRKKLDQPDLYSGIIFTSPRCVQAVICAIGNNGILDPSWNDLFTFAVGEATAKLVEDSLKLKAKGSHAGNGVTLAPFIIESKPNKPLLLPCGNLKMDTLENLLAEKGIITDSVEVYETVPHPDLESTLAAALAKQLPSHIVYFSPSGIHNTYPLLQHSAINLDEIKWVSIGPTTAAALESYNLPVHCTATKPNPKCLADAITGTIDDS